jgi:phospholipid/cholesterol/gamma-HCH transport system substrate-binding protein
VLEQVGLGPEERSNLSHTITQVRQTVDAASPRLNQILADLQGTAAGLRETADAVRPSVEASVGRVENLTRKLDEAAIPDLLAQAGLLAQKAQAILDENRPLVQATLTNVRDLTADARAIAATTAPQVQQLVVGLDGTRQKVDLVLGHAETLTRQSSEVLTHNRANLERTMANVREATDHGVALVQKLRGNPFYLSPFYKPTKEDVQAQEVYDAASSFLLAARELNDTFTKIQAIRGSKPLPQMTKEEQLYYNQLFQRAWTLQSQLDQTNRRLAEGIRETTQR